MILHARKFALVLTLASALFTYPASAVTTLSDLGDINTEANWDNGLPSAGNDGTIAVTTATNSTTVFNFGGTTVTTHSAGTITSNDGFNFTGGTWNMTGGKIITRYFLANNSTFNLSGGVVELSGSGNGHMGAGNSGEFYVSGSVVLDGSLANQVVQTGNASGVVDIAAGWTGSWTWGNYSGTNWRDHFTNSEITFDGAPIDGLTFDTTFQVTDGGKTLSLIPPGPLTDFDGGDMLLAGNWTNGLPLDPPVGTVSVDGTFDDGNSGVADWRFSMSAGTITVGQDWHFTGASAVSISGGALDVSGDILSGDASVMNFLGGAVNWAGSFAPSGTPGGTINISGGTFVGTANGSTSFGNTAGGALAVSGGSVTASTFEFGAGVSTTLSGSAVLSGASGSFGVCDIRRGWNGSFTLSGFSGIDWQTQFTLGNITLDGNTLDAAGFAQNFVVSDGGQTLRYDPRTDLVGGDILTEGSWNNGLPSASNEATIAVDGSNAVTVFGFGGGAIVNQTAGTITAADGFNFNRGDTWNLSGGKILARYVLANGAASTINLSGGTVELADVEGAQHMGATSGAAWNVSGSAVLDGTHATLDVQAENGGTVDIASDWTGSWTWGIYSGSNWRDLLTTNAGFTFDGAAIDGAVFDANFQVSADGKTLSMFVPLGAFRITEFVVDGVLVTLTWTSRVGESYVIKHSTDCINWGGDLKDAIGADPGETTTETVDLRDGGLDTEDAWFLRVEKE